jgi:membrane protein
MELGRRQPGVQQGRPHLWWRPDLQIWKYLLRRLLDDSISSTASQLAFHLTFTFFPMLMVLAFILTKIEAPFLFARILFTLRTLLPHSTAELILQVLNDVPADTGWGIFFTGLSLALWWAIGGLHVLIYAINTAYGVTDDRPYWLRSLLAIIMTLLMAVLLVLATALVIGGQWLGLRVSSWFGYHTGFIAIWALLRWPVIIICVMSSFLLLYTAAPKLPISLWRALPGAILGGVGWVLATVAFGWYIRNFATYNRVYGSIGGFIVLMLWLYVGSIVVLLGAELNGALYRRRNMPSHSDS